MVALLLSSVTAALSLVAPRWPVPSTHASSPPSLLPYSALAQVPICSTPRSSCVVMAEAAASGSVDEICDVLPEKVCVDVEADADAVFTVIDENGDGSISRAELLAHLTKSGYTEKAADLIFDKLDTDKSEEISKEELRAGFLQYTPLREAPGLGRYNAEFINEIHTDADALFAAVDADNSGSISKEELRDHLKQFSKYSFKAISNIFQLLDVNNDGYIEKQELRDAFVKYSALRQAIGEGPNFK